MTAYQETNAGARSSQDDMKVQYTARLILRAVGAAVSPGVMMAA